jgi:uncharacterized phage infection (PIP) family protein YhgE
MTMDVGIKILGAICVIAVSLWTGKSLNNTYKNRCGYLSEILRKIDEIKNEITYKKSTVGEIFLKVQESQGKYTLPLECWNSNCSNNNLPNDLKAKDKEIFLEFVKTLGTYQLNEQISMCNYYYAQIEELLSLAKIELQSKGKLIYRLSFLSALFLIILFI